MAKELLDLYARRETATGIAGTLKVTVAAGVPGIAEVGGDVLLSLFELTGTERLDPERVHILLQESTMSESNHEWSGRWAQVETC